VGGRGYELWDSGTGAPVVGYASGEIPKERVSACGTRVYGDNKVGLWFQQEERLFEPPPLLVGGSSRTDL